MSGYTRTSSLTSFCDRMRAPRMYCQPRSSFSSSSIVSLLIMPRSATMQTLVTPTAAEPIHHRDQRRDIGRVAGPQLAADRPPLTVEHRSDDHLLEVGSMVLAVATLTDCLSPLSLEVNGGRVEEDQLELSEQVGAAGRRAPPR